MFWKSFPNLHPSKLKKTVSLRFWYLRLKRYRQKHYTRNLLTRYNEVYAIILGIMQYILNSWLLFSRLYLYPADEDVSEFKKHSSVWELASALWGKQELGM